MQEEKLSYSETCRRFEVNSRDQIRSWERIYLTEGPEGLYAAFSKHRLELTKDNIITGEFRETIAYNRVKAYLEEHGKNGATAFLCFSDVMALGVMRAVNDLGYSVPDDFSVTGFDDIPIAGYTTPKLTTIQQDMEEVGYRAAELLQELIKNPSRTENVYVPYRFIERNSVKKLG